MCLSIKRFCKCHGVYRFSNYFSLLLIILELFQVFVCLLLEKMMKSSFLINFSNRFISDRQSKLNSESLQSEEIFTKRSTKVSSICILPTLDAAPISSSSSHPPSIVSSVDEGGFNEPSPEIKAKLKPAYTYETSAIAPNSDTDKTEIQSSMQSNHNFNEEDYNAHQHSLHYVDFGYRLNPDGSESKQCFTEEQHATANTNGVSVNGAIPRSDKRTVHYPVADSVVYAAIKSEPASLSPPVEPKFNCDSKNYRIDDYPTDDNVSDIDEKFEQIYSSTTMDLDTNNDDDIRLPDGDSSFNLDNVEFADASDKEELEYADAMTAYEADRLLSSRSVSMYCRNFSFSLFLLNFVCFACKN